MKKYLEQVRKRVENDLQAKFVQILREENKQTDRLAKATLTKHMLISSNVLSVQLSPLIDSTLPNGKEATRKLKVQAARFDLIKDILYKRGFPLPYLRCLATEEADYVMREVHEGICGNHLGSRSLVHKLI